jgi:predicted permease
VLTAAVVPPAARYEDDAALRAFEDEMLRAVRALPGVTDAAVTSAIPFGGSYSDSVILAEGYVPAPGESLISPDRTTVSPGYFEALDIPLVQGRSFRDGDTADAQPVIIVDERLADKFWPDGDALGKRMFQPQSAEDIMNPGDGPMFTIVGIVGNVRRHTLEDLGELDVGAYYFSTGQEPIRGMDLAIEVAGDPGALVAPVRRALAEIDAELPLFDVRTLQNRIDESLLGRRSPMLLALVFAALALFLASVGIYGVLAYLVSLRRREIGIRMALGSDRGRIFRLVLGEGVVILLLGFVLGLAGVSALQRAIASQLFGVHVMQPAVLVVVVALLAAVALVACAIPALRATRVDPVTALTAQ